MMAAYLVVQATITDEPRYQKYREAVVPPIKKLREGGATIDVWAFRGV
jgi:uncharacterized protein (DUF1330 family)